jgi:hypothetical protein
MVAMLFDGDLSFGERMKGMFKDIGIAVVDMFITPAKEAISTFISETITDLLSGKGLGGVLQNLQDIGSAVAGAFGGGAKAAGSVAGAAGSTAGSVGGMGSTAGSVASGTLGTVTSVLGAVGSIGSMVSGIIGNFQNARQEKTLNAIEESTRYSMLYLGGRADQGILGVLFQIAETLAWGPATKALDRIQAEMLLLGAPYINPSLDSLKDHTASMRDRLIEMRDQSRDITINLQVDAATLASIVITEQAGLLRLQGAPA